MGGCGVGVVLGLMPAQWWVELSPGVSGCRTWGSWSWCWPPGGYGWVPDCPWAGAFSLVGQAGSWGLWLWVPGDPGVAFGLLVGGTRSQQLAVGQWGLLGLVLAPWCVGPGPRPSGGQNQVLGWLWAQGVLRKSVCWGVGLCPCPASCLA